LEQLAEIECIYPSCKKDVLQLGCMAGGNCHRKWQKKSLALFGNWWQYTVERNRKKGLAMERIELQQPHIWNCRLDTSGRIVLPQALRNAKGLQGGDELVASFENDSIVLRTYEEAIQLLQDAFCAGLDPNISLVDELLEERRRDAELDRRS
jgi:bifunctional DNA-binding transcriptional regulator/antitoxin component of YhaV-PrlF toxin-antitoxin module